MLTGWPAGCMRLDADQLVSDLREAADLLDPPAPQAQPDARAVEGEPVAWQRRMRNANAAPDHPHYQWGTWKECDERQRIESQETGKVEGYPGLETQVRPLYLSAPAADDGWRPSREEVAAIISGAPFPSKRAFAKADAILALHPAAPTDEVGKS